MTLFNMLFLLRQCNFQLKSKLNNIYSNINVNLKKSHYNDNKFFSIRSDLGVSDKLLKNYIKLLTDAHNSTNNYDYDEQLVAIVNRRQVSDILIKRSKIQEDLKNLKELGNLMSNKVLTINF